MDAAKSTSLFIHLLVLLAAAVVSVPIFKRLGLSSILGYLAAGILIGPSALGVFKGRRRNPACRRTRCRFPTFRHRSGA